MAGRFHVSRVYGVAVLCAVAMALAMVFCGCEAFRGIEGDWGGYWWYSGVRGDVYITWTFEEEQFRGEIPSAGARFRGTYTTEETDDAVAIDLKITASDTSAWVVGDTYRGYYRIADGTLYRSQLFPRRPAWSEELLDPQAGTVFVAERTD